MKPSLAIQNINDYLDARIPVYVEGHPGVGKSQGFKQIADARKIEFRDFRASLHEPSDLTGCPFPINGRTVFLPPGFLPRDGAGLLLMDEINRAAPLMQSALLQLVLDRRCGEYVLPDGWLIAAAGNAVGSGNHVVTMDKAMQSRFAHVVWETDLDDWTHWAMAHNVPSEVIYYLRFAPAALHEFDPKSKSPTFPCPRTWEYVSRLMAAGSIKNGRELSLYSGIVGEGRATELVAFLRVWRKLPSPDAILMDPDNHPLPDFHAEPSVGYALVGALAKKAGDATADRLVRVCNRLPVEFQTLLILDSQRRSKEFAQTRAFVGWCADHPEILAGD